MAQGNGVQLDAERSHVMRQLVSELGGLAHADMPVGELDRVLDNMLSKGIPSHISDDMKRWIHTHRQRKTKIAQILGAHVNKIASIIPECFGKYHDAQAPECKVCLDRAMCSMKTKGSSQELVQIKRAYRTGVKPDVIAQVLQHKSGQMAKVLARGAKVVLVMKNTSLRLLSVEGAQPVKETIDMAGKGKPVVEDVEEEEVEVEEGEVEDLDEDAEEGEEEVAEEEEEVAPAKVAKVKKEKKPKAPKNKAQQDFQNELDKLTGADKQAYSAKVAKQLKVTVDEKGDARIDHMLRCMAINKKLAGTGKPATPVATTTTKKVVKK